MAKKQSLRDIRKMQSLTTEPQAKIDQTTASRSSQTKPKVTIKRGKGRPKQEGSKRQGVAAGTHINLNIIIPTDLHKKLGIESFTNKEKDMSDIITDLLTKHYKNK